jgi:hypothetical protein
MSDDYEESYFDEPAPAPRREDPPRQRRSSGGLQLTPPWIVAGLAVLAAIVLVVYFAAIRNTGSPQTSSQTSTGPINSTSGSGGQYKVAYPKDWAAVDPNSVAPGQHAFAAFRQKTGKGVVVMRLESAAKIDPAYVNGLKTQLQKSVTDFRFVSSHELTIQGKPALDFTYERTTLHEVRNVVVIPVGNLSVVMATIAPIGSTRISQEVNDIVSSFTLTS